MLNNKGQSLIMFVLVIPILLLLFIVVLDVGNMLLVRRELDNINYIALDYGVNNIKEEHLDKKIEEIIYKNDDDIVIISNEIDNNKIIIRTEKKYDGYFLRLINSDLTMIKSSYMGYIKDGKEYIERLK